MCARVVMHVCELLSHLRFCVTPWTVACHAPLSMGFSRQEYLEWFAVFLLQGNLPDPGIEPKSLASPALPGRFFTTSTAWESHAYFVNLLGICWTVLSSVLEA